jgi:dienelactone hydrolase
MIPGYKRNAAILISTVVFLFLHTHVFLTDLEAADKKNYSLSQIQPEKIKFFSKSKTSDSKPFEIQGYLFRPKIKSPSPAIVAMHGCGGLFNKAGELSKRHNDWAVRLTNLGYVVLFPDSFTPRGIDSVCEIKKRTNFSAMEIRPLDAYGALAWLQSQDFVKADSIGLLGWSNGGTSVLASVDESLKEIRKEMEHDFKVAVAFYPGCRAFNEKPKWHPIIPTTILIGEADDWTPAAPCISLVKKSRASGADMEIFTFPNAYHGFDNPDEPLKTRKNLAFTSKKDGVATTGTNPKARADVIERVPKIFDKYLKK